MADILERANNQGVGPRVSHGKSKDTMKVIVRFLGLPPSETLREHAERQALFHLGRFGGDLDSVDIRIRDVNGPKGGEDKQCQVFATGRRLGFSTLRELSEDAYQAVDAAMARLARTVARQLDRARDWKAGPHLVT
jgi:putative sigma-54 modulation protein